MGLRIAPQWTTWQMKGSKVLAELFSWDKYGYGAEFKLFVLPYIATLLAFEFQEKFRQVQCPS